MKSIILSAALLLIAHTAWSQRDTCEYVKTYFTNGHIEAEGCMKKKQRQGVWKEYTEDGYLRFQWTYKNGQKDGPYKALYANGAPEAIGQWKEGHLVDTLKYFSESGELVKIEFWVADRLSGASHTTYYKTFYKNAKPDGTIEVIDGKEFFWMDGEKHEMQNRK